MTTSLANDQHACVANILQHVLVLDEDWAWVSLPVILASQLSVVERRRLLAATFCSVTELDAHDVIGDLPALNCCSYPVPGISHIDADARWWASTATLPEVRAWLAACYARLPACERKEFLASAFRRLKA
ncbi:MAG: hypothetical protein AAFQ79_02325 [Pseudomonadota bacterium]